jgi:hypothetical protein
MKHWRKRLLEVQRNITAAWPLRMSASDARVLMDWALDAEKRIAALEKKKKPEKAEKEPRARDE